MRNKLLSLLIIFLFSADIFADNYSLSFDGVDDYVNIPENASLTSLGNGLSVSAWVYFSELNQGGEHGSHIISQWGPRGQYLLYINGNNIVAATDGSGAGNVSYDISLLWSRIMN